MSHVKLLRGNFARQLFNATKRCKKQKCVNFQVDRRLATKAAPAACSKFLSSPWGEIQVGEETLTEYVFKDIEMWSDKPSVTCGISGRTYDYMMMRMMIERCAGALLGHLKLSPGDKLGLILPNLPEFVVLIHGAMRAGLVVTFANPLYTADEVRRQFSDCSVKAIATIEMFMPVAKEVSKSLKDYKGTIWIGGEDDKAQGNDICLQILEQVEKTGPSKISGLAVAHHASGNLMHPRSPYEYLLASAAQISSQGVHGLKSLLMADHQADLPDVNVDDVCLIPYSSGTTGMPKGVMLTHKNLVSNLKQMQMPKMMKYEGEPGHGDTVLTVPPFFHIYGFNGILNYNLTLGYHVVTMPRFTPEEYIKCLVEFKPTTLFVVPSLLAFLATHPNVKKEHLQSVETIMVGAAPTTDSMLEKFLLKCEKTKDEIRLLQGYGMTESSPVTLMTPYVYPYDKVGSVGQLVPSTQAKIVSLTTGEMLGPHKSGEMLLRGPQVMKGYWNNEKATKETVDDEGWLHTGDVAYYDDDHYFYVVDRTKELIKVKGNQVSPTEIESIIMEMPEVADVAVVGVPDPLAGEVPKAFVVLKANHKLTEKQVYDLVAKKLTKYKHLEGGVAFLETIPRNVAGKILRNELKVFGGKTKKH